MGWTPGKAHVPGLAAAGWACARVPEGLGRGHPAQHVAGLLGSSFGTGLLRSTSKYNTWTCMALFMERGKVWGPPGPVGWGLIAGWGHRVCLLSWVLSDVKACWPLALCSSSARIPDLAPPWRRLTEEPVAPVWHLRTGAGHQARPCFRHQPLSQGLWWSPPSWSLGRGWWYYLGYREELLPVQIQSSLFQFKGFLWLLISFGIFDFFFFHWGFSLWFHATASQSAPKRSWSSLWLRGLGAAGPAAWDGALDAGWACLG